jgi:hypothetical protein
MIISIVLNNKNKKKPGMMTMKNSINFVKTATGLDNPVISIRTLDSTYNVISTIHIGNDDNDKSNADATRLSNNSTTDQPKIINEIWCRILTPLFDLIVPVGFKNVDLTIPVCCVPLYAVVNCLQVNTIIVFLVT